MKKKILIITMLAAFLLSGCAKVIELTSEEEDLIAEYVATQYINNYKKTFGLMPVDGGQENNTENSTHPTEAETLPGQSDVPQKPDVPQEPEETESVIETTEYDPAIETDELVQALDIKGVELEMLGYSVESSFPKDSVAFVVEAPAGRKLLVVEYDVWNSVDAESVMELDTSRATIKAVINGTTQCNIYKTMLKEDILNMNGTKFAAGEAKTGVLIFSVKDEIAEDIQSVSLSVTVKQ